MIGGWGGMAATRAWILKDLSWNDKSGVRVGEHWSRAKADLMTTKMSESKAEGGE